MLAAYGKVLEEDKVFYPCKAGGCLQGLRTLDERGICTLQSVSVLTEQEQGYCKKKKILSSSIGSPRAKDLPRRPVLLAQLVEILSSSIRPPSSVGCWRARSARRG